MTPHAQSHRKTVQRFLFLVPAVAVAILFGVPGTSRADIELNPNFSIGGFIFYNYTFLNNLADGNITPTPGNNQERHFDLGGEVDLKVKWSWATARIDLNLPSDGNEEQGMKPSGTNNIGIEQMRFDIMPKFGQSVNLTMTGGVFNSPYGREAQDPTDRSAIDPGLQFYLTPSNLLGLSVKLGKQNFSFGGIVANEWHTNTDKQLSYGVYGSVSPTDKFSLFLGGLFTTKAVGDNYLVNSVAQLNLTTKNSLAIEGNINQNNYAIGATLEHDCAKGGEKEAFPGGVALRYDYLRARANSDFTTFFAGNVPTFISTPDANEYHQATITGFVSPFDHLKVQMGGTVTKVNYNGPVVDNTWYGLKAQLLYQF